MNTNSKKKKVGVRSQKRSSDKDTLHFLASAKNDLTLSLIRVKAVLTHIEEELDFVESLIEENK